MVTYFRNPTTLELQPDRRRSDGAFSSPDRRARESTRVTSEQYAHLRECLLSRERRRAELSASVRRVRHVLVGLSAFLLALFVASSITELTFQLWGTSVSVPTAAIAAIAPFLFTYLIVLACDQARTKMRLGHECQRDRGRFEALMAPKLNHLLYGFRDGYLVLTLAVAYGWAVWLSGKTFIGKYHEAPHATIGILLYLACSLAVAIGSPLVFRTLDRGKRAAMKEFLAQGDRVQGGLAQPGRTETSPAVA